MPTIRNVFSITARERTSAKYCTGRFQPTTTLSAVPIFCVLSLS